VKANTPAPAAVAKSAAAASPFAKAVTSEARSPFKAPEPAAPIKVVTPQPPAAVVEEEMPLFAVDSAGGDRELTEQQIASELAAGSLTEDTLVWRDGMAEWLEIGKVPELARHLPKRVPAPKPTPAAPIAATPKPAAAAPIGAFGKSAAPSEASASPKPGPVAPASPLTTKIRPRQATIPMGMMPEALLDPKRADLGAADATATPKPPAARAREAAASEPVHDTTPAPDRETSPSPLPRAAPREPALPPLGQKFGARKTEQRTAPAAVRPAPPAPSPFSPSAVPLLDDEPTILRASPFTELEETPQPRAPLPESIRHLLDPSAPRERSAPRSTAQPKPPSPEAAPPPSEPVAKLDTFRATPEAKRSWFPETEPEAASAEPPRPPTPRPAVPGLPTGLPPLPNVQAPPMPGFPGAQAGGAAGPTPAAADPLLSNPLLSAPFAAALTSTPFAAPAPLPAQQQRQPGAPLAFDEVPSFRTSPWLRIGVGLALLAIVVVVVVLLSRGKDPPKPPPPAAAPATVEPRAAAPAEAPPAARAEDENPPRPSGAQEAPPQQGAPARAAEPAAATAPPGGAGFADLFAAGAKEASGRKPSPTPSARAGR
jgi:nicotinate-nucleotide--dimethylbenzimidazole phosphoribosyltransferase